MMTRLPSPQNDYLCCKPVQVVRDKNISFEFCVYDGFGTEKIPTIIVNIKEESTGWKIEWKRNQ